MASYFPSNILSFLADAAIARGKAVKPGSDKAHVAVGSANTSKCIGVLQTATTAAEDVAEVAVPGGGGVGLLGETVVAGDGLCSHSDGSLVLPNAISDVVIAIAMEGGVSGDLISIHVSRYKASASE